MTGVRKPLETGELGGSLPAGIDTPSLLFAGSPLASMPIVGVKVQRHAGSPEDGWQKRTFRSHVLTLFAQGAVVEHAIDGRAPRRIVIPTGGVVSSLREITEAVRLVHESELFAVEMSDQILNDAAYAVGEDRQLVALKPSTGIADKGLTGLMMAMRAEAAANWSSGALFTESLVQALAILLATEGNALTVARHGLPARLATRVVDMIEESITKPLRLSDLAVETGYSVAQFCRLFRRTFGTSLLRYVTARRIERACRLLKLGTAPQIEIALSCGFQSQQHFSRVFRAQIGLTPETYRNKRQFFSAGTSCKTGSN